MPRAADPEAVILGFRAFDPHELLLHFVAERMGHYERARLAVCLSDLTFTPEDKLARRTFSTACGATIVGRAQGTRRKVVLVATERPMFWMYARAGTDWQQLRGARIATFPPGSPPWLIHRAILSGRGLDPDQDVRLDAARDDVARLGLLRSGNVAAAVLSSHVPPARAHSLGLTTLLFFGDEICMPTTGLAVSEEILSEKPGLARRMVEALRSSLTTVHESASEVLPVLEELLDCGPEIAESTLGIVRACFTRDGRASADARRNAIDLVNREYPGAGMKPEDVYDDSLLPA
ncbi:MAG TPA: hypothetical protein VNK82_03270 [Terriglobales bacterium]|nr:hypothetical protein [Terriglobales bacterium]